MRWFWRKSENVGPSRQPGDLGLPTDESLGFLRMRDRLDANLRRWLNRGCKDRDLLRSAVSLSEAEVLLGSFRTSLSKGQFDYLEKSLKAQHRRRLLQRSAALAGIVALAVVVAAPGVQSLIAQIRDALQTQLRQS